MPRKFAWIETPVTILTTDYKGRPVVAPFAAYRSSRGGWEICGRVEIDGKPSANTIAVAMRPNTPRGFRLMSDAVAVFKRETGHTAVHWNNATMTTFRKVQ